MPRVLFATSTLAARIERAESQTVLDFALQACARGRAVVIEHLCGGVAVYAGPGQPFNKVAGLGFHGPVDESSIARVEAAIDAVGGEIRVELSTLADPSFATLLSRRGYALIGHENVLGLALTPARVTEFDAAVATARNVVISRATAEDLPVWRDTVIEGFAHPDAFDGPPPTESFDRETLMGVFEDSSATPGIVMYLAHRDGELAGAGSIRIADGLAQMSGASTLPAHRRRGVQSTLLRARLSDAARSGCDLAVTCTEPASKSQENMQRAGFELLYSRAVLLRPASAPSRGGSSPAQRGSRTPQA
jgi:ribosomal protein S18 acetylase RimI-like enzyme